MHKEGRIDNSSDPGRMEPNVDEIAARDGRRRQPVLYMALITLALVIACLLAVFFLAPALLPWSGKYEAAEANAMLSYYKPDEAMRIDASLLDDSYFTDDPPWGDDEAFSLLIIGNDYDYSKDGSRAVASAGRADTIMLLIMPRRSMSAGLISIPRDTMVTTIAGSTIKLNSLYRTPVPTALMAEISRMTGVAVDRWVSVDFSGFVDIVDILGGVDIDVQKRMKYKDNAGGYSIDLLPGLQHFDGVEALRYVRYRSDALGDIARVERQLGFVRALAAKAMSWDTAGKLFGLVYIAENKVESDLSFGEAFSLGIRLLRTGTGAIGTWKAPGAFNGPYWQVDGAALRKSIARLFE